MNSFLEKNTDLKEQHTPKNNNLEYIIDQTFRNISSFFDRSFKNDNNDPTIDFFDQIKKNYIPLIDIKDFYALMEINNFLI